jgi:hypothetical protein
MKPTSTILAAGSLLTILNPAPVRADDSILTFELTQPAWSREETNEISVTSASVADIDLTHQPLPIPPGATTPPMRYHSPQQLPAGVYRRGIAAALNADTPASAVLPPAPPPPSPPTWVATAPPTTAPTTTIAQADSKPLELDFAMAPSPAVLLAQAKATAPPVPTDPLPALFEGNSDSLVAWAVGSAEGTRTPNGGINRAYFGHTDPGNRAWNMGTFSYQHGASTPEEADQKQLARLQNQAEVLRRRALRHGLNLTLEETLNGLDLANQSPLAAIGSVGYIERLSEAKHNGMEGAEAILVARTRSYINPKTGRWNAPGLGNTEASIRRDQQRRATMVAQAIAAYTAQNSHIQAQTWVLYPPPAPADLAANTPVEPVDDVIFTVWTSPSDPEPSTKVLAEVPAAVVVGPEEVATGEPTAEVSHTETKQGDRIAALLRLTVDRLTATPEGSDGIQIAALPSPFSRLTGSVNPSIEAIATRDSKAGLDHPVPAIAAATAGKPASWAEVREGNQNTPAASTPTSGAFPDTMVYLPTELRPQQEFTEVISPSLDAPAAAEPDSTTSEVSVPEPSLPERLAPGASIPEASIPELSISQALPEALAFEPPLGGDPVAAIPLTPSSKTEDPEAEPEAVAAVSAPASSPQAYELPEPSAPWSAASTPNQTSSDPQPDQALIFPTVQTGDLLP